MKNIIDKTIFNVNITKGTGAGGQHKNKVETCVTITHIPTGIKETCQETRKKNKNIEIAYTRILERLKKIFNDENHHKLNESRKESFNVGVIRTYNFQRNEVKDHRNNKKANLKKVLNGDIDILK